MRYVILILTILTILSLFKEDTIIEIKQKFIVKTYVLSLLMTQQQSQSDKPLSQFDLLLLSQQQQSQEHRKNAKLKKYKKYHQKKKMLYEQKEMEEENKEESRKRPHPETESSTNSNHQSKKKQNPSQEKTVKAKDKESKELEDEAIGIDHEELIEMFDSNDDKELYYLQIPEEDDDEEEDQNNNFDGIEENLSEEDDDEYFIHMIEEIEDREQLEEIINNIVATQIEQDNQNHPERRQLTAAEIRKLPLGYKSRFDENKIIPHTCGNLTERCSKCGALFFKKERNRAKDGSYSICCSNGKVVLPDLPECPDEIKELLDVDNPLHENFVTNLRSYNSAMSFASFGAKFQRFDGPASLTIKGSTYHMISNAETDDDKSVGYVHKTDKKGKLVFINGAGGCGKTYTYNAIIKFCEEYGVKYSCYAYTGIAASLLKNGKTLHHGFGLPIKFNGNGVCSSIIDGSFAYGELVNSLVMFIDEISMVSKPCIEFIDEYLKSIMNNNEPFGGKIIITGGDFRQILPVLPYAGRSEIIQNSIIKSEIWQLFKRFDLIINVRAGGNEEFANWQKDIGEHDKPVQLNVNQLTNNLLKSTFGNLFNNVNEIDQNNLNENDLETRAILTTTNNKARLINEKIIEKLPGEMKIYYSEDSIPNKDDFSIPIDQIYSKEFLARQNPGNLPPHELKLKLKTIVMLVRNINTSIGLCNGTRMSIERLGETTISCKVLTGPMKGRSISLPQMNLIPSDTRLPFPFQRKQFPIVPSFAMTINKSQGQSFNFVGVDLTDQVFSHGQLYVAVSRCRSAETLKFHVPIKEDMIPKNISSDVKKDIIKKLNDDNCDLKEILGENFTVSVKNVVYENVLPRNDNNDTH